MKDPGLLSRLNQKKQEKREGERNSKYLQFVFEEEERRKKGERINEEERESTAASIP